MTENEIIENLDDIWAFGHEPADEERLAANKAIDLIQELQQYRAIGTVEECREARERQKEKKPVCRSVFTDGTRFPGCPTCFSRIDRGAFYCSGCGQKLDWH